MNKLSNPREYFETKIKQANSNDTNCNACLTVGLVYCGLLYPELKEANQDKALFYLHKAIEAGDEDALNLLVHAYLSDDIGGCNCIIRPDYEKWLNLCEALSVKGNQMVAYSTGLWFSGFEKPGEAVSSKITSCFNVDKEKAIHFFLLASRGPEPNYAKAALEHLCYLLTHGLGDIQPDLAQLNIIINREIASGNKNAIPFKRLE